MTHVTNARIAGSTFLIYIAAGMSGMMIRLPGVLTVLLSLVMCLSALVLAVTLYAITRDEDPDIALMGLTCRVAEGILGAMFIAATAALRSQSTASGASDAAAQALSAFVSSARGLNTIVTAAFFAVGSTLFCWLFLRGRMIPVALAWLGLLASILLIVVLPLQLGGVVRGLTTQLVWLPMLAFEVPLGVWLLVKGIRLPPIARPPGARARPATDAAVRAR